LTEAVILAGRLFPIVGAATANAGDALKVLVQFSSVNEVDGIVEFTINCCIFAVLPY